MNGNRFSCLAGCVIGAILLVIVPGCRRPAASDEKPISDVPQVEVVKPTVRTIVRNVGQPSFVEAYEQTAIYPKFSAYIEKWNVDIGDRVKKDQPLATLFVPELLQEYEQKKSLVVEMAALVKQAEKLVDVGEAKLKAADFKVKQARANVGQSQALVSRWESEVNRLTAMVRDRVVDKQVLAESERQLQSNKASHDAALAAVDGSLADQAAALANLEKARVDVGVARARLQVATADRERVKALTGYLTLTAPFDGIIVARNANAGDFVLPATGDPSAAPRSSDQSASKGSPIYVVARTDLVRVYIDVAEADAVNIVCKVDRTAGDPRPVTKGKVRINSYGDAEIPGEADRCTWALNFKSRTLRTEIDLPNPGGRLRPGMYAYGMLKIERANVKALPMAAITEIGNQFGCYLHQDGKAVWTQVQTGVNDGKWIEVQRKLINGEPVSFNDTDEVIISNLSELSNGREVRLRPQAAEEK